MAKETIRRLSEDVGRILVAGAHLAPADPELKKDHAALVALAKQVGDKAPVIARLAETVLERLEHRLHVRERRPEIVASPGDELAPRIEQAPEVLAHLVEGGGELGDLGRAVLGSPSLEVATGEVGGRCPHPV